MASEDRRDAERSTDETNERDWSCEEGPEVSSLNFVRDAMFDVSGEVTANWEQMKSVDG